MALPLRILFIAVSEDAVLSALAGLQRGGYAPHYEVAGSPRSLSDALDKAGWDAVLHVAPVPDLEAEEALRLVKERNPGLPFLAAADGLDEAEAAALRRAGAGAAFSSDETPRLGAVVKGVLAESRARHERLEAAESPRRLEEALAQLDMLLATAPVGLAFWDRNLLFVRVNEAFAAMLGVEASRFAGRSVREAAPELAASVEPVLSHVLETEKPVRDLEISCETSAMPGEWRHWLASYFPVRARGGRTMGVGAVLNEMTERKRAEMERLRLLTSEKEARRELQAAMNALRRREDEFRLITNAVPAPIFTVDAERRFRFSNRACNEWLGHPPRELRGKPIKTVLGEALYENLRPEMEAALAGRETSFERWVSVRGASRYISATYVPYPGGAGGRPEGFVALVKDLTERQESLEKARAAAAAREPRPPEEGRAGEEAARDKP
jgi:PAS domain S-box-containing protein